VALLGRNVIHKVILGDVPGSVGGVGSHSASSWAGTSVSAVGAEP